MVEMGLERLKSRKASNLGPKRHGFWLLWVQNGVVLVHHRRFFKLKV